MKKIARAFSEVLEFVAEWTHQVTYLGFMLAALFFIYNVMPVSDSIIYTLFIIAHFISIAVAGFGIGESDFEEAKGIRTGFIVFNIIFIGAVILITKSLYILLLVLYMLVTGSIYLYITLHYIHGAYGKKDNSLYKFSRKHKNVFYILVLLGPVIALIISLAFLPWNLYVKIGIALAYIISMPFIGMATENGFDLEEVFLIGY